MELLKKVMFSILVLTFALSTTPIAIADMGAPTANVNKELNDKINQLENRLKQLESKPAATREVAPAYAPAQGGLLKAAEDINVSGYVETSYNANTKRADYGAINGMNTRTGINDLRSFDAYQNSFVLNALKLTLEKTPAETGGVGFRTDLMFGEDAKWLNAVTKNSQYSNRINSTDANGNAALINDVDNVFIEQAYGVLRAPYGNGIDFYFGKFVSLLGFEVIENKDNWNASRGLIFSYAIPYTYTGLRSSYEWNDKFTTIIGINNGGNQDLDDNNQKTLESKAIYKLTDKITLSQSVNVGFGGETPTGNATSATLAGLWPDNNQHRGGTLWIFDTNVGIKMTDKWSLNVESLWRQDGLGDLYGVGLWNRYEFNDWIAFSHRFEWMNDSNNNRFGAGQGHIAGDHGYHVWENTFGTDFKVYKNLLTRMEYRFDQTPENRFDQEGSFQSTFLASLIYSF